MNQFIQLRTRNFHFGDEKQIFALSRLAEFEDKAERALSISEIKRIIESPYVDIENDFFIAEINSQIVGFAGLDELRPGKNLLHRAFIRGIVHPKFRRMGIGSRLMGLAESHIINILHRLPPMECAIDVLCRSTQLSNIQLCKKFEMNLVHKFLTLNRTLNRDLPIINTQKAKGIRIRSYKPGTDQEATLYAINEAFQDHWGYEPKSFGKWKHDFESLDHFQPKLWLLAFQDNEIVGAALNYIDPDYIKKVNRKEGYMALVGVRRNWRRQGIATALITQSLLTLKQYGMTSVYLYADSCENLYVINLYKRLGFHDYQESLIFRKIV